MAGLHGKVTRHDAEVAQAATRPAGGAHAFQPLRVQGIVGRSAHHGDPLVPQSVQVLHHSARGGRVVDVDAGDAQRGIELAAIDHRCSGTSLLDNLARRRRQAMPQHDQTIGLVAPEHLRVALLALGQVLGVAQQDGIANGLRRILRALQDLREERVGDVRHGDQDLAAALGLECPGHRVGHVAQRSSGLLDARASSRQHFVRPGKRSRHRACGDADVPCDVVDGGHGVTSSFRCAVHNGSFECPC